MTWNEQNKANSIMDVIEGTVQEWYDQVDGLLKQETLAEGDVFSASLVLVGERMLGKS